MKYFGLGGGGWDRMERTTRNGNSGTDMALMNGTDEISTWRGARVSVEGFGCGHYLLYTQGEREGMV